MEVNIDNASTASVALMEFQAQVEPSTLHKRLREVVGLGSIQFATFPAGLASHDAAASSLLSEHP